MGNWTCAKDFWEYDPATNIWTQKADFPGDRRRGASGFSIGNKGYLGLGAAMRDLGSDGPWEGYLAKDFWEYDPATDTWTRKADVGGPARHNTRGVAIGNKGYIIWGQDSGHVFNESWEYDPTTDAWTRKADPPGALLAPSAFVIGNKAYYGMGIINEETYVSVFLEYDPATDTWTQKDDGNMQRVAAACFSIGNKGYIGTGVLFDVTNAGFRAPQKDFWEYSPDESSIFLVPVADKTFLWPANNKMVPVTIWSNVSSSVPVILSVQISCNEPPKHGPDWTEPVINQATGEISFSLRATREGSGTGRVYTITITATDANGNSTTEAIEIVVPHDQGNN